MSLEQLLREALRDVAARLHPDPEPAYRRFRRRRLRKLALAAPAFAAAALAAALVATVAVAQLRPDPAPPAGDPLPTPAPTTPDDPLAPPPLEFEPGPRTVEIPSAGYAIDVPDGWEVAVVMPEGVELRLRPESERQAGIQIGPVTLPPETGPGKGELYPADTHFREDTFPDPSPPYEYSRRPDGHRMLKAGRAATDASYYIAWPYHCPQDVDCPVVTKLRTLGIRFFSSGEAWPEVSAVGESLVANARPITNALPGGDTTVPRVVCDLSIIPGAGSSSRPGAERDLVYEVEITNGRQVPCQVDLELTLQVLEDGQPAPVRHSPGRETIRFEGPSPEELASPGEPTRVVWRWTNWCGDRDDVALRLLVNGEPLPSFLQPELGGDDDEDQFRPVPPPPCLDADAPSDLAVFELEE